MKIRFPAMEAVIGQRKYYTCVMKLSAIPKMFTFTDWVEFTAEEREQRVLNRKRIPDIARYILDNEDGYIFSSITASYKCGVRFEPVGGDGLGYLEMDFEDANFVINDGQHRCAAISQAIKANPALGEEAISVLLFHYESRERVQQMFSDLNRFVVKTSRSLDILYDQRDVLSKVTLEVSERVPAFQGMVDKDAVHSLPARSEKMFSLSALYDANDELLTYKRDGEVALFDEMVATAVEYWTAVSGVMPDWAKVKDGRVRPVELRQEKICTHAVVLRAIGGLGAELTRQYPSDWKGRLRDLQAIDWSKKNREWENVCMVANSIVSNRQARLATKAYLKRKLGLALSEAEERSVWRPEEAGGFAGGASAANGVGGDHHGLVIRVRWSRLGKELPDEEINGRNAAGTVVQFVERLIRVFGRPMAEQLTRIPILRFPLSRNPEADFQNGRTGQVFSHAPISGTDLHMCTISDNEEKVRRLRAFVGKVFPGADGAVEVSLVP